MSNCLGNSLSPLWGRALLDLPGERRWTKDNRFA